MPAKRVHTFLCKAFGENLGPARAALRALGEHGRSRAGPCCLLSFSLRRSCASHCCCFLVSAGLFSAEACDPNVVVDRALSKVPRDALLLLCFPCGIVIVVSQWSVAAVLATGTG